jgi:heme/copper-type cytochrome/quinol oxidase subunit 2
MRIDTLLSTIILVSFLVTIVMAIGSYAAYKLRERRRPHAEPQPSDGGLLYFERIHADDER